MWTSSNGQTFPSFFVETHPFPISGPEPRLWQNCGTSAPQSHRLWILPGKITYCLYISCRLTNYSSFCFLTCTLGLRVRVGIFLLQASLFRKSLTFKNFSHSNSKKKKFLASVICYLFQRNLNASTLVLYLIILFCVSHCCFGKAKRALNTWMCFLVWSISP